MENRKVNVLGTEYTIKMVKISETESLKKNGWCGSCNELTHTILIGDPTEEEYFGKLTEEEQELQTKLTTKHELIHAVLNESGMGSNANKFDGAWPNNEEMVDFFARQAHKIFKIFSELELI